MTRANAFQAYTDRLLDVCRPLVGATAADLRSPMMTAQGAYLAELLANDPGGDLRVVVKGMTSAEWSVFCSAVVRLEYTIGVWSSVSRILAEVCDLPLDVPALQQLRDQAVQRVKTFGTEWLAARPGRSATELARYNTELRVYSIFYRMLTAQQEVDELIWSIRQKLTLITQHIISAMQARMLNELSHPSRYAELRRIRKSDFEALSEYSKNATNINHRGWAMTLLKAVGQNAVLGPRLVWRDDETL